MWKCLKCNTVNDGNFCTVCGNEKPHNANLNTQNQTNKTYNKTPKTKSYITTAGKANFPLIAVCIVLAVILAVLLICLGILIAKSGNNGSTLPPVTSESPTKTVVPTYTPTPTPQSPTPTPTKSSTPTTAPQEISYSLYTNAQFSVQCAYPANFSPTAPKGNNALKAVTSPDSTSTIIIRARTNDVGITISKALDEFYDAFDGTVNYESVGNDYYIISITNGNRTRYRKFFIAEGNFYCLDFEYDNKDSAISAEYIEYMEDSFKII